MKKKKGRGGEGGEGGEKKREEVEGSGRYLGEGTYLPE
jgi:hypothetical protein